MNKHGVSGGWFTEVSVKYFKSGTLRTFTKDASSMLSMLSRKKIPSQVYFKDFVN